VKNLIGGRFSDSKTKKWIEVRNPVRACGASAQCCAAVVTLLSRGWSGHERGRQPVPGVDA
jgi:hypothetical protein